MYLRPHFLEELHAIREEMSRECDYDMDLFAEKVRDRQFDSLRKRAPEKKTRKRNLAANDAKRRE